MQGDFILRKGEKVDILVGQMGGSFTQTAGGGGGTFVVRDTPSTPTVEDILVIAGGGGGWGASGGNGYGALTGTAGRVGPPNYAAGANGNSPASTPANGWGKTSGSFLQNAVGPTNTSWASGTYASSYINGGAGGSASGTQPTLSCNGAPGGFGGGAGGACNSGGAGGGFSAGGAGGGAGGALNTGTNQVNTTGNTGHGYVEVVLVQAAINVGPSTVDDIDRSVSVTDATNYLASPSSTATILGQQATIESWIYQENCPANTWCNFVTKHLSYLLVTYNNTIWFAYHNGGGWQGYFDTGVRIQNEAWHHVALTRNGGTTSLYLDGELRFTGSGYFPTLGAGGDF
jgi:hypothetical protein